MTLPRFTPYGYPMRDLFPGAARCQFRLAHLRDDGLAVQTCGDQRGPLGTLEPVDQGQHDVTVIAWRVANGRAQVVDRILCNNHPDALREHLAALAMWGTPTEFPEISR